MCGVMCDVLCNEGDFDVESGWGSGYVSHISMTIWIVGVGVIVLSMEGYYG